MTTSLVTGGAGFIGSHVAKHLLEMGHKVVIVDNLSGGSIENVPVQIDAANHFYSSSITDAKMIDHIFEDHRPDYVFHLAAYAAEGLSHFIRHYNYEVNVLGSINLINAAVNHKVKRFVFTSSAAVYGEREDASENDRPYPIDPYGIAKLAVEQDLRAARLQFGLPYTIFRCHNVYGPGQNIADPYRNVVGIFMRQCLEGKPMTIFGDGYQSRCFTYIDDVAPNIARCINMESTSASTINIGSSHSVGVNELAVLVAQAMGVECRVELLQERHEVRHVTLDHDVFESIYGIKRFTSLKDGLARMAKWVKTQELRPTKPFASIEIEQGLPESWRAINEH